MSAGSAMRPREPDSRQQVPSINVITPSYRPDLELCADLHDSVLAHLPPGTQHQVIVPRSDMAAFSRVLGSSAQVHDVGAFLPSTLHKLPRANAWLESRRPWPPVRGWVAQQLVKLEAAARSHADLVLLVDSDLVFVRPVGASMFMAADQPFVYRAPDAIHAGMPRHVTWHRVARELLGLPASVGPPLPDYVCWPGVWEPRLVRAMLTRVEQVAGRPWARTIGSQLHFSEMILYGVYVDEVLPPDQRPSATQDMRCRHHSEERSLTETEIAAMVGELAAGDVAVMISARSGTDLEARRRVLRPLVNRSSTA